MTFLFKWVNNLQQQKKMEIKEAVTTFAYQNKKFECNIYYFMLRIDYDRYLEVYV